MLTEDRRAVLGDYAGDIRGRVRVGSRESLHALSKVMSERLTSRETGRIALRDGPRGRGTGGGGILIP